VRGVAGWALLIDAVLWDLASTWLGLRHGGHELSPAGGVALGFAGLAGLVALKGLALGAVVAVGRSAREAWRAWSWLLGAAVGVLSGLGAAANSVQLVRAGWAW